MSVRVFVPVLREVERGLGVAIPDRLQILRELESDLEALRVRYAREGMDDDEARRRAIEALVPDSRTLAQLDALHAPWYRRVTHRLTAHDLRLAERGSLALACLFLLLGQVLTLRNVDLLGDPSPLLWPVLALGTLLFGGVLAKAFQFWVKREHGDPTVALNAIIVSSGMVLAVGFLGVWVDLYLVAEAIESTPSLSSELATRWLVRNAALLAVSLGIALAGSVAWLVMSHWWWLVSGDRRELLDLRS